MFFFKSRAQKAKKKTAPKKKTIVFEDLDEKQKILLMIRKMRKRISPDVLSKAEQLAFSQIGVDPPIPPENEASRLFKIAMANNGERRAEILALVERRVNKRLH
tara:strand:+ start:822 stop:1133 length:312 start_codon:yes stop_codon:yes gene_type:complete